MSAWDDRWLIDVGVVVSNLDGVVDEKVAQRLKDEPGAVASHTAWEFCGAVRWDAAAAEWVECVMRYRQHVGTYRAATLDELRTIVNDEHGWG